MWPTDIWGTSQALEKKHIRWILTSWKHLSLMWYHSYHNGNIYHFQWGQDCGLGSPRSLWFSGSLGRYRTLLTLTSFSPLCRRPVSAQGLALSPGLNYAVGMFVSDLAFWMHPCPVSSSTSCSCLLDRPWKCLVTLSGQRLLVRFVAVTSRLCPLLRPCGTATLSVGAWPVLGHLCFMTQPCSHCSFRDCLCPVTNPQWEIQ